MRNPVDRGSRRRARLLQLVGTGETQRCGFGIECKYLFVKRHIKSHYHLLVVFLARSPLEGASIVVFLWQVMGIPNPLWPPGRNCRNSYGLTVRFLRRPSSSKHRL